jgi:inorganic triphosphatase YgiF
LHRKQLTLRVRTLAGLDFLTRCEWEDPIASKRPDLDAPNTGKRLPDSIHEEDLQPVFTTRPLGP